MVYSRPTIRLTPKQNGLITGEAWSCWVVREIAFMSFSCDLWVLIGQQPASAHLTPDQAAIWSSFVKIVSGRWASSLAS